MAKKYTQAELEEAYQQMQEERYEDGKNVMEAARWLMAQVGPKRKDHMGQEYYPWQVHTQDGSSWYGGGGFGVTPWSNLQLVAIHETYGPSQGAWEDWLDKQPFAKKKVQPPATPGQLQPVWKPGYEITTPHGTYDLVFEYFDNHCTGY